MKKEKQTAEDTQPNQEPQQGQTAEGSDVNPILMNDQTDTSTAMPLLPPDEYALAVVKVEQKRNSKDTGDVIKIQLKTTVECTSITGELVAPGFPLFHTISITPTPDYTISSINRALANFEKDGCGEVGAFFPLDRYEGKIVRAKVKVQKGNDDYPDESNKISRFVA
jgi:hypothetical protein